MNKHSWIKERMLECLLKYNGTIIDESSILRIKSEVELIIGEYLQGQLAVDINPIMKVYSENSRVIITEGSLLTFIALNPVLYESFFVKLCSNNEDLRLDRFLDRDKDLELLKNENYIIYYNSQNNCFDYKENYEENYDLLKVEGNERLVEIWFNVLGKVVKHEYSLERALEEDFSGYDIIRFRMNTGLTDTSNIRRELYVGDVVTFETLDTTKPKPECFVQHQGVIVFNNGEYKIDSKTTGHISIISAINIKKKGNIYETIS